MSRFEHFFVPGEVVGAGGNFRSSSLGCMHMWDMLSVLCLDMYSQRFVVMDSKSRRIVAHCKMKGPFMGCLSCTPCLHLLLSLEGFESAVYSLSYCRNNIISLCWILILTISSRCIWAPHVCQGMFPVSKVSRMYHQHQSNYTTGMKEEGNCPSWASHCRWSKFVKGEVPLLHLPKRAASICWNQELIAC